MRQSIQIAGAFIGLIVGAGFASGQEILQFFTSFGWYSIFGTVLATVLFAFLGMSLTRLGCQLQTDSHKAVIYHICGRYFGVIIDFVITFFLFGVLVVMLAGAGSIFEQQFGISSMLGSIIITVLTIVTVTLNVQRVISIIGLVTPFLLILVIIICGYSFATMDYSIAELQQMAEPDKAAASNWVMGGLLYASYNIAAGVAMLVVMGGTVKNVKTASLGGVLGGLGLGVLILFINLGMLAKLDVILDVEMPMLFLANELSPVVGMFMSVILLGMVFNTAVGMLYAFTARVVPAKQRSFNWFVALFGVAAFGASFIGFTQLVGTVYPLMGYLGFAIIGAIIISWMRNKQPVKPITTSMNS